MPTPVRTSSSQSTSTSSDLWSTIPWGRFAVYWILTYFLFAGSGLLLYTFWLATANSVLLFALQVWPPAFLVLMSWLYFRKVKSNDWPERLLTAFLWILLIAVVSAALMTPVYGASWTAAFTQTKIVGYGVNMSAILLGGIFAAIKRPKAEIPEGLEL